MRKVYCGTSGSSRMSNTHKLSEIRVSDSLRNAFLTFCHGDLSLRPAQDIALFEHHLLEDNDNVIISTPTNSGKSLLSYLLLFNSAAEGKTVILVEPLRALAYEKSEELKSISEILKRQSKIKVGITITTGDYRLTDEFMHSAPSSGEAGATGQIIVATPERLDALSRVAENRDWFKRVALVCIDEAHLISDSNRGATLELLIAFLRSLRTELRIILMSATISNPESLAEWLSPCNIVSDVPRYPQLEKWVYCLDREDSVDSLLLSEVKSILTDPKCSVLIFVYQTASAEKLATAIAEAISNKKIMQHDLTAAINAGVAWFHSKLSAATKASILHSMEIGTVRVAVSTTALSMGINLPATHVFVRDTSFTGYKDLDISDLMQMIGRAGRGDNSGTGIVLLSGNNLSKESTIVSGIKNEEVPVISSRLVPVDRDYTFGTPKDDIFYIDRVGNQLMGILNRYTSITMTELEEYLSFTLGGSRFEELPMVLRYLSNWKEVYFDEDTNEYQLTHLGRTAAQYYLPPLTAANLGQFVRDLLSDKPSGEHIAKLKPIDYLIILCLVSNENKPIVLYNRTIPAKIASYMEALPLNEKSYLYRTWITTAPENLLGSAHVIYDKDIDAQKYIMRCVFLAMLIYDLSKGVPSKQTNEYYKIDVEEIQEKLRDNAIWILCGIEQVLEIKSFYYHLKSNLESEPEQIQKVEAAFKESSKAIFSLVANLKFRSNLGELIRSIKRVYPNAESYPGEGTLRKLEGYGIHTIKDLVGKTAEDLKELGIRKEYSEMIAAYIKKRMT